MVFTSGLKFGVWIVAACLCAHAQDAPAKDAPAEIKGLPPRVAPTDYQAHGQAGPVTIAAEFRGHAVPPMQGTLTTEDYVTVEVGLFGPADARMKISAGDFSLRVNDKKTPLDSQPYGLVIGNVKDPEWEPPPAPAKSKTSLGGDGGEQSNEPPRPVKVPLPVQRAMAQRVQKSALPEGVRALPQAGLLFFPYRGKQQGIRTLELIYAGGAGKLTLKLQP